MLKYVNDLLRLRLWMLDLSSTVSNFRLRPSCVVALRGGKVGWVPPVDSARPSSYIGVFDSARATDCAEVS